MLIKYLKMANAYQHATVVDGRFGGDGRAYINWLKLSITEARAELASSMAIIGAKADAITNATRVTSPMLISLKRDERDRDEPLAEYRQLSLTLADYDTDNTTSTAVEAKIATYIHEAHAHVNQDDHDDGEERPVDAGTFKQVLKPDKLSSTASPSLGDWTRRFRAYFATSRVTTAPIEVQAHQA